MCVPHMSYYRGQAGDYNVDDSQPIEISRSERVGRTDSGCKLKVHHVSVGALSEPNHDSASR